LDGGRAKPPSWTPGREKWIDDGPVVREAAETAVRQARVARPPKAVRDQQRTDGAPFDAQSEARIDAALSARSAPRYKERIAEATRQFEREHFFDARREFASLAAELPDIASVREMHGLSLYRLGRWGEAISELEAHRTQTGSVEHLAVLADCYRAKRRYAKVDELWEELKAASPSAALVAEGRIVAAGALADRGNLRAALALMNTAEATPRRVRDHNIKMWYVIGDLYDRSGEVVKAREFFKRVQIEAPGYADVESRLAALR
jgi:tetratricopeptide (TPR) repeat protein